MIFELIICGMALLIGVFIVLILYSLFFSRKWMKGGAKMSKKVIAKTDITPDYSRYLYVLQRDESTKKLNVIQVDKSSRSKGIKNK